MRANLCPAHPIPSVRPRSFSAPHRNGDLQYLDRLRHRQGGRESSFIAAEARRHHRPLSGGAARYFGNLCGPPGTSPTHPAHASSQRQAHSWSETRSTPTVGPHALPVRFCYLAAEGTFTTRDLYPQTLQALRLASEEYKLGSLRYDLWKLRAKGLVDKIPHSRRYRLLPHGYQICLVFRSAICRCHTSPRSITDCSLLIPGVPAYLLRNRHLCHRRNRFASSARSPSDR